MRPIDPQILKLLVCPDCGSDLILGADRLPSLICTGCSHAYAIIDGILDLSPKHKRPEPGIYRTQTLSNVIAGIYDFAAPLASLTTWRCSPLRYFDVTNTALGRANRGVFVSAPIGTGLVIDQVLADYHDVILIGVDSSWEMLRQAQKRFEKNDKLKFQLIHCDLQSIPLRDSCADSVQSLNGLHSSINRIEMLNNFARIGKPDAYISGSALVRGVQFTADFALNQLEKWGIVPILRTSEFLLREMETTALRDIHFATFGAVLFWDAHVGNLDDATQTVMTPPTGS